MTHSSLKGSSREKESNSTDTFAEGELSEISNKKAHAQNE